MKSLILSFFLLSSVCFAQIETEKTVVVEQTFASAEAAKPALLHEAVLEGLKQHASELGIDFATFEGKLKEKFNLWFEDFKTRSLSEKFGKNFAAELSEEQKKEFLTGLEARRSAEFLNFAKLGSLVDNYAFKTVEKNPTPPETWKGTVVLNLNRPKVERMYSRLQTDSSKVYQKIFIVNEMNLLNLTWQDLGLESEGVFTEPLLTSWNKWFQSNQPSNVEEVVSCTRKCLDDFSKWQALKQGEGMQVPHELSNSIWVRVSFNLRKVLYKEEIREWHFVWDGSVLVLDSNTKKIISSTTMNPEKKVWRGLDQKSLNSKLASSLYRSPLEAFTTTVKKVQDLPRLNRLNRLIITGHQKLDDVLLLIDQLKKTGTKINFEVQLDTFSQKEAQVLCFYQGEEKSFTDLLSQVKELKSSHSYKVVNEFTGVHHVLKLVAE